MFSEEPVSWQDNKTRLSSIRRDKFFMRWERFCFSGATLFGNVEQGGLPENLYLK